MLWVWGQGNRTAGGGLPRHCHTGHHQSASPREFRDLLRACTQRELFSHQLGSYGKEGLRHLSASAPMPGLPPVWGGWGSSPISSAPQPVLGFYTHNFSILLTPSPTSLPACLLTVPSSGPLYLLLPFPCTISALPIHRAHSRQVWA